MTPQILVNNLERNADYNSIHDFTLLIFDECHHTKKDEPYNKVMRLYLQEKLGSSALQLPQVFVLPELFLCSRINLDAEFRPIFECT